jgi:hypothetical protein
MRNIAALFLSLSVFLITGCDHIWKSPSAPQFKGSFSLTSSSDGTFLLNNDSGAVWRYTAPGVFHAIPTVTEDTLLMKLPNGEKKEIPLGEVRGLVRKGAIVESDQGPSDDDLLKALDNSTVTPATAGKPCDKKTDPLCIR